MLIYKGLLVTVLLSFSTAVFGRHCLKCDRVISPRHCHGRTTCDSHEVCHVEKFTGLDGEILYNVGCKSRELCVNSTRPTRDVTNGQMLCSECCDHDLCNVKGCGAEGYPYNRGPICFNCQQSRDPSHCDQIAVCGRDDECHIEEQEEFGDIFYTTKCISKHLCNEHGSVNIFGKRDITKKRATRCAACCKDDLCNNNCYKDIVTGYNHTTDSYYYNHTTPSWWNYNHTTWHQPYHTDYYYNHTTNRYHYNSTTTRSYYYQTTTPREVLAATGHYGNSYVVVFLPNHNNASSNKILELLITSPYSSFGATINSNGTGYQRYGQSSDHAVKTPLSTSLQNYQNPKGTDYNFPTGVFIKSNKPIFVAGLSSHGCCSGEAFSALPIRNLGRKYVIATYPKGTQVVGIVATKDNTYVRADLKPRNYTINVHLKHAGETAVFTSGRYEIETGGVIEADAPVGVFTGNTETSVEQSGTNFETEMMIPVEKFSKMYIVPKIYGTKSINLRVIPSPNDHFATVYISGKNGFYKSTYKEFVNELELANNGYFINAQRNVMVSLYASLGNSTGKPFMTLLPAINQYSNNYVITTPSDSRFYNNNFITLIFKQKDGENGLLLNGGNLLFHAVDRTPVEQFNDVYLSISVRLDDTQRSHTITHMNSSVTFGLLAYGFADGRSAYGYPGGFNFDNQKP